MNYTSLSLFLLIGAAVCSPETVHDEEIRGSQNTQEAQASQDEHIAPLEKRSPHYDFGLGKRAYSYVSEYKRLPVYNFGLGKRSRPYSFGLGKRSIDESQLDEETNAVDVPFAEIYDQYDDVPVYEAKRARPYSFGLGKRFVDDDTEEKRAKLYEFGLGKRLPMYNFGLGKRARSYNFGLGKRLSSKFNFGLGKREREMGRFNFGLGKRSSDDAVDKTDNELDV